MGAPELPEIPMWVAGYGPKALAVAGRVGDGVIIQLADPVIIQWIMDTARKAAEEAGRDPSALQCIVCAPSHITDDIADARPGALVSGDGLQSRHGHDRAIRLRVGDPGRAHGVRARAQVLRLRRTRGSERSTASSSRTRSAIASASSTAPSRQPWLKGCSSPWASTSSTSTS